MLTDFQLTLATTLFRVENESMTKIIINDTIYLFLKTAISISLISNHNSFRVLFEKKLLRYILSEKYIYILALCQLYRHTFIVAHTNRRQIASSGSLYAKTTSTSISMRDGRRKRAIRRSATATVQWCHDKLPRRTTTLIYRLGAGHEARHRSRP